MTADFDAKNTVDNIMKQPVRTIVSFQAYNSDCKTLIKEAVKAGIAGKGNSARHYAWTMLYLGGADAYLGIY